MTITHITRAALYLRSSKDRSDVSIDAQRRQLQQLASERGLVIVAEFSDAVESGKDENRPGFQQLVAAVKNKRRGWDTLLLLDTSRLARRRHIALIFEEVECRKHGVKVVYKSLPEADPLTEMVLKSILQAWDEYHSLSSKQKGLAGMAENVKKGFRAGGRAPVGYQLEHIETGAVRDGSAVKKSRLVVSDDAPRLKRYLKLRAQGVKRPRACDESGFGAVRSTLVGIEWNALTYAGHTVWNMRYEQSAGGFTEGVKRRPRSEWLIQRDTHEALITDEEAEALLVRLESYERGFHSHADYLLTGILKSPGGENWRGTDGGAGGYYRLGRGKRIKAVTVEETVMAQVTQDLRTPVFVEVLTKAARAQFDERRQDDRLPELKKEYAEMDRRIKRLTEMLADTARPEPMLRQIEGYEDRRIELESMILKREEEAREVAKVRTLATPDVAKLLNSMAGEFEELDREKLRDLLSGLVEQVVLDDTARTIQIIYRLSAATGLRLASPRRDDSMAGGLPWLVRQLKQA